MVQPISKKNRVLGGLFTKHLTESSVGRAVCSSRETRPSRWLPKWSNCRHGEEITNGMTPLSRNKAEGRGQKAEGKRI